MKLTVRPSSVQGTVAATPSKSLTHRAMVLASLANGESRLRGPLISEDTVATMRGMEQFGASFRREGEDQVVRGGRLRAPSGPIDCGNSGTTIRLLSGIASLLTCHVTLTGDASLQQRPMKPLLTALTELGVHATSVQGNGSPPIVIRGPNKGRWTHIKGDISSQFISSLLISSALKDLDTEIVITTPLKSRPYVEMTRDMMSHYGASTYETKNGYRVLGGQRYRLVIFRPGTFMSALPPGAGAWRER